ncbi:hypothetical protein MLD52_09170 [Puniceicoccaceae bacterium K14]|nr:hypothetical protein [Puniceicoccaceae bacterium K14]
MVNKNTIGVLASWVSLVTLPVLLALCSWALLQIVSHGERITRLEALLNVEPLVTRREFRHELDRVSSSIRDHEDRIRKGGM